MHPQNAFAFFMAEEKSTFVLYNHSEMKYCSTVFTTGSQYSAPNVVYIKLHI